MERSQVSQSFTAAVPVASSIASTSPLRPKEQSPLNDWNKRILIAKR
jgi:hypothetical protein